MFAKTTQIVFIDTCSSIYFMDRSKCGIHLLMVIYKIQANHNDMVLTWVYISVVLNFYGKKFLNIA